MNREVLRRKHYAKRRLDEKRSSERFLSVSHVEICSCGGVATFIIEIYGPKNCAERGFCHLQKKLLICSDCLNSMLNVTDKIKLKKEGIDISKLSPKLGNRPLNLAPP